MHSVHNQKNQTPNKVFVRKNEAGSSAIVANFFRMTFDQRGCSGAAYALSAGSKRFPLVSSYQSEKPTT